MIHSGRAQAVIAISLVGAQPCCTPSQRTTHPPLFQFAQVGARGNPILTLTTPAPRANR
jgi:hypothetical protein